MAHIGRWRKMKYGAGERSTKAEGLPKNNSIKEFLDEPRTHLQNVRFAL